jgi:alpha-tubulin suppressor-like RCC1 family protein
VSGLSSGVVAVAAHWAYNCALTIAGAVKCWGNDWSSDGHTPVEIVGLGSDIVAITVGLHACALTRTGAVKCWGRNDSGQLGDGTTTTRSTPVAVSGLSSGIVAIAAGERHTCALTKSGAVKCWGSHADGVLGDGTTTDRHTPVDVPDLEAGVTAIAAGSRSTCALTQGGGVKCWGAYQLGDGRTTNHLTPVAVSGLSSDVVAIAAGPDASCAVTRTGAAKCWGYNAWGQLGDGTTTSRLTPVPVFGLSSRVVAIAVGGAHACALIYTGGVRCWGLDSDGELGDGRIFGVKPRPVTVAGFTALVRSRTWISTRTLGAGAHGLRATYPGDALHGGSSGTAAHAVR